MRIYRFPVGSLGLLTATAMLAACSGASVTPATPSSGIPSGRHAASPSSSGEHLIYSFTGGADGGNAATGLVLDTAGNLYGTAVVGGKDTCGVVFKLAPKGKSWQESVLYNFDCFATGKNPHGGVAFDPQGNLDGTTVSGGSGGSCGSYGCGVAFQLAPSGETVLHSFSGGDDGFGPGGGVVFDTAGNLYGTAPDGGSHGEGVIYEVTPSGSNGPDKILHAFNGDKDGGTGSLGSLLMDKSGALYGVTETGGAHGAGTAYKLKRDSQKKWKLTILYTFQGGTDATSPYGGLVADAAGNLYGTTYYGGANGLGAVYKLVRSGKGYHEHVLYSFKGGSDGSSSTSTLIFGKAGDLYGTTSAGGGECDCGTIFKVDPKTGKERVLHAFGSGSDGAYSYYGMTSGANGNLYGATVAGGTKNQGAVFEFTP
jgi:uncharacterized repeat protein (TIGR03803 family)